MHISATTEKVYVYNILASAIQYVALKSAKYNSF